MLFRSFGAENEIRVEADVPKEGHGRWYTGGGIYRPVHLYIGEENYIEPYGVKVTTQGIHPAKIRVEVCVRGTGQVSVEILRKGECVVRGRARVESSRAEAEAGTAVLELTVPDARLWSAETPELYQARVTLDGAGTGEEGSSDLAGRIYDQVTETFGIRTISTDPEKGLLINGVATFLRGGCIHNDNGVIGVINNDATELHRALTLKKSGFNEIGRASCRERVLIQV